MFKHAMLVVTMVMSGAALASSPTYDLRNSNVPFAMMTAATSNANTVCLPSVDVTIVHSSIRDDGQTASVATDYVMITVASRGGDLNVVDGVKIPLFAGASITFPGDVIPSGPDGDREISLQAAGHGAKLLFIRGRKP